MSSRGKTRRDPLQKPHPKKLRPPNPHRPLPRSLTQHHPASSYARPSPVPPADSANSSCSSGTSHTDSPSLRTYTDPPARSATAPSRNPLRAAPRSAPPAENKHPRNKNPGLQTPGSSPGKSHECTSRCYTSSIAHPHSPGYLALAALPALASNPSTCTPRSPCNSCSPAHRSAPATPPGPSPCATRLVPAIPGKTPPRCP